MKETKRKGFNFFRSYYDVYNELESDSDKVKFIEALFARQFHGTKPNDLKGMVRFAYVSQVNSIDTQVKGYEDKLISLNKDVPNFDPWQGVNKKVLTPTLQEKVKGQGKGKEQTTITPTEVDGLDFDNLLKYINTKFTRQFKIINSSIKTKYKARIKDGYTNQDIKIAIDNCCKDNYHKETNYKYCTPEFFSRSVTLDKYSETTKVTSTMVQSVKSTEDVKNLYQ